MEPLVNSLCPGCRCVEREKVTIAESPGSDDAQLHCSSNFTRLILVQ